MAERGSKYLTLSNWVAILFVYIRVVREGQGQPKNHSVDRQNHHNYLQLNSVLRTAIAVKILLYLKDRSIHQYHGNGKESLAVLSLRGIR